MPNAEAMRISMRAPSRSGVTTALMKWNGRSRPNSSELMNPVRSEGWFISATASRGSSDFRTACMCRWSGAEAPPCAPLKKIARSGAVSAMAAISNGGSGLRPVLARDDREMYRQDGKGVHAEVPARHPFGAELFLRPVGRAQEAGSRRDTLPACVGRCRHYARRIKLQGKRQVTHRQRLPPGLA